jgi:hypothetical protein
VHIPAATCVTRPCRSSSGPDRSCP